MGKRRSNYEWAHYRVVPGRGIELLHAHYTRHTYERHAHDGYALGVTEAGVQSFAYRGANHSSTRGTVIVLLPAEPHDGHTGAPEGFTYRMLYIEPRVIRDTLADAVGRPVELPFLSAPLVQDPLLARLIGKVHGALAEDSSLLRQDELLGEMLVALATRHSDGGHSVPRSAPDTPALARVRDFLHGNFATAISADDVARVAGMSRFHVSRQFRRAFGLPPHAYLLRRRLDAARHLLAAGEDAASVAASVGFADQSHLIKRFKGAYGITPGQFARAANGARSGAMLACRIP